MQVSNEMYTTLFNAITDANAKLQQARKCIVQAEQILNIAQAKAEDVYVETSEE